MVKFANLVAQKSEGKIKVRGYSDGQLGAEVQSISSAQGGVLEMSLVSTAAATGNVKEFASSTSLFSSATRKKRMRFWTARSARSC